MFIVLSIPYFFLIIVFPFLIGGETGEKLSYRFCLSWYKLLFFIFGIKLRVMGKENIPQEGKFVIFSNHLSFLDIPSIVLAFGEKSIRFIAKEGLLKYPVIGWGIRIQRHPLVKKNAPYTSIKSALRAIREKHIDAICIFPEGTRGRNPRELLPFKEGVSFLFSVLEYKFLPVAIFGTEKVFPIGSIIPKSGVINVIIGKPFEVDKKEERKIVSELMREELRKIMINFGDAT